MAVIVKYTMTFLLRSNGWSETWYKSVSDGTNLRDWLLQVATPIMLKRRAMCCQEVSIESQSASDEAVNGDSVLLYTGGIQGTCPGSADSPHTTVYTIIRAGTNARRKALFIRGQPDDVVILGGKMVVSPLPPPPVQIGVVEFVQAATTYLDALKDGGWGWMRNNVTTTGTVEAVTLGVPPENRIGITTSVGFFVAPNPIAGPTFNRCRILFKGLKTNLNGTRMWEVESTNSAISDKPIATFGVGEKKGKIVRYTPVFTTFETGSWDLQKTGRRAAGRPLLATPGRASAAPLG